MTISQFNLFFLYRASLRGIQLIIDVNYCVLVLQSSKVSNLLVTLNSSVNFIIYCICSRDFRTVLHRMLPSTRPCGCCRRRGVQQSPPPIAGPRSAQRRQDPSPATPDPHPADPVFRSPVAADGRAKLAYRAYGYQWTSHRRMVKMPGAGPLQWN